MIMQEETSQIQSPFEKIGAMSAAELLPWLVLALFIALGLSMRIAGVGHRSLWIDEAWVANLIESENFLSAILHDKADYWTPIPFLFAVSAKIATLLFGRGEAAFRLLPLLFGIGSVLVFSLLNRRIFAESRLWMVPVGLLALHPTAIYYSKELKQYSGEMFFTILLLYLFYRALREKSPAAVALFFLAGLFGIGFGVPTILLACGASVVLSARLYQQRENMLAVAVLGGMFLLGIIQILIYALWLGPQMGSDYSDWWAGEYYPPNSLMAIPGWLVARGISLFDYDFAFTTSLTEGRPVSLAFGLMFCLGVVNLFLKKKRDMLYVYAATMGLMLVMAFMHKWPLGGVRINLFLLPFHLIFVASGIGLLASVVAAITRKSSVHWVVGSICVVAMLPIQALDENLIHPLEREEMRSIVEYLGDSIEPESQRIYVYYYAKESFRHYWSMDGRHSEQGLAYLEPSFGEDAQSHMPEITGYCESLPDSVESVYLVFSHIRTAKKDGILELTRKEFGAEIDSKEVAGASAYLFKVGA